MVGKREKIPANKINTRKKELLLNKSSNSETGGLKSHATNIRESSNNAIKTAMESKNTTKNER